MGTDFCVMCDGNLDEEEKLVGFCLHCQVAMYRELVQEAERNLLEGQER